MKTHEYIPILLLLIFASSYCGLAQTENSKTIPLSDKYQISNNKGVLHTRKFYRDKAWEMEKYVNISLGVCGISSVVALSSKLISDGIYNKYQNSKSTTDADRYRKNTERFDQIAKVATITSIVSLTATFVFMLLESNYNEKADRSLSLSSNEYGIGLSYKF